MAFQIRRERKVGDVGILICGAYGSSLGIGAGRRNTRRTTAVVIGRTSNDCTDGVPVPYGIVKSFQYHSVDSFCLDVPVCFGVECVTASCWRVGVSDRSSYTKSLVDEV